MPVSLIDDKCIGCRKCVDACPPDVLRMNETTGLAEIAHQRDCQICHLCRLSCPVDAITITPDQWQPPLTSWA